MTFLPHRIHYLIAFVLSSSFVAILCFFLLSSQHCADARTRESGFFRPAVRFWNIAKDLTIVVTFFHIYTLLASWSCRFVRETQLRLCRFHVVCFFLQYTAPFDRLVQVVYICHYCTEGDTSQCVVYFLLRYSVLRLGGHIGAA